MVRRTERSRIWDVGVLAEFSGLSQRAAKAWLKQIDAQTGGALLKRSGRALTFERAALKQACPQLFWPLPLEWRLEELDARFQRSIRELTDDVRRLEQTIRMQAGQIRAQERELARRRERKGAK